MLPSERGQELGSELISPCVQKTQGSRSGEPRAVGHRLLQLGSEHSGPLARCGVPGTMALDDVHLRQVAAIGNELVRIGKTEGRDGEPWREVTPGGWDIKVRGGLLVCGGVEERVVRGMLRGRGRSCNDFGLVTGYTACISSH